MSFFYKIELVFYKGFYPLITNNRDPCRLNHTTQLGIDWRNGILLHYNATLNQDWQGTELAQGGSAVALAYGEAVSQRANNVDKSGSLGHREAKSVGI